MSVNIDDTDPAIQYSGSWQVLMNSPLQYGGGVHSSTQTGASASITFVGTRIHLFCTVPMNSGTETAEFTFDGHTGPPLSRETHPDTTYYKDLWFDSGPLENTVHVLTVSDGGGTNDAPLQLDYFSVDGSVVSPTPTASPAAQNHPSSPTQSEKTTTVTAIAKASPATGTAPLSSSYRSSTTTSVQASSTTSSASTRSVSSDLSYPTPTSTGGGSTVTSVQYVTTAADGSVNTAAANASEGALRSSSSRASVGAIIGGVLGGLIVLLLILLLLLWRRRSAQRISLQDDAESRLNPRNPSAVIPFRLDTNNSSASGFGTRSREMEPATTKFSPSRYVVSTSALGSEVPAMSTISNNASSSDEKDLNDLTSPSANHPDPVVSPFSDLYILPEEDAGPFRPPPSYQSFRGSKQ